MKKHYRTSSPVYLINQSEPLAQKKPIKIVIEEIGGQKVEVKTYAPMFLEGYESTTDIVKQCNTSGYSGLYYH